MYRMTKDMKLNKYDIFAQLCVDYITTKLSTFLPKIITISISNDLTDVLQKSGGAYHVSYTINTRNKLKHVSEVYIYRDIFFHRNKLDPMDLLSSRYQNFFDAVGVPVNEYSVFLFCLLHEVGHAYIYKLFTESGLDDQFETYSVMTDSLSRLFMRYESADQVLDGHNVWLPQFVNGNEAQADIFVYTHFMTIWKEINGGDKYEK